MVESAHSPLFSFSHFISGHRLRHGRRDHRRRLLDEARVARCDALPRVPAGHRVDVHVGLGKWQDCGLRGALRLVLYLTDLGVRRKAGKRQDCGLRGALRLILYLADLGVRRKAGIDQREVVKSQLSSVAELYFPISH